MPSVSTFADAFEVVLILLGLVVLWREALSPAARARSATPLLPTWEILPVNFLLLLWAVYVAGFLVQFVVFQSLKSAAHLTPDMRLMFASAGTDAGMLVAWRFARPRLDAKLVPDLTPPARKNPWPCGILTFLAAMPVVAAVGFVWQNGLQALGFPLEKQESVDIFANARAPLWLAFLFGFAVILAPVTEELVHRGAIFRYARGRLPRWLALLGPALLFAGLHLNLASFAPLAALGILFSLVYERTGDLRVTMIAHGLFNLNTAVMIFAGIGTSG
jgi:membrane protease YdiL (CAAX protease family)